MTFYCSKIKARNLGTVYTYTCPSPCLSLLVPSEWVVGQFGLSQHGLSTLQWCLGRTWTHQAAAVTPLWKEEQRRDPATH